MEYGLCHFDYAVWIILFQLLKGVEIWKKTKISRHRPQLNRP